jgi:uncharacterized protein (TIGR03083 family)
VTDGDPREILRSRIDVGQVMWRELVAEVGEDRMDEPGPMGDWTFKDLAGHLLAWRERSIARLEAAAEGRPQPAPFWPRGMRDDDTINAWIREQSAGRSATELVAAYDDSFDRLADALAALPPATLTDPAALPWLGGASAVDSDWASHLNEEHLPSVRAWLATRG